VDAARRLLQAHLQAHFSDGERAALAAAASAVLDFDAPQMRCPACGFEFETGPKECPDCGLFLG